MTQTVIVVIATYRRPERLRTALDSLLAAARGIPTGWRVGVVLVDDDPRGSARPVAAEYQGSFDEGCGYIRSGAQNISTARNLGLEHALPRADWVASIDDDVVVPPHWFETCIRALYGTEFNAVTGPLLKDFSHGPAWLTSQPFDQLGLMTDRDGEETVVCATGNNWMRAQFIRQHPSLRFSPDLGRTGGEDMDFFHRAVRLGLRPVYSQAAAVIETEPASRCTLRYQVRRALWLGMSEAQISLRLGLASRRRLVARATKRLLTRGAPELPGELLPRRGARFTLAIAAQCLGLALGSLGFELRHR